MGFKCVAFYYSFEKYCGSHIKTFILLKCIVQYNGGNLVWEETYVDTLCRIKQLLDEKNWSMYKLSKASGVAQSTLSNMFSRNNVPSIGTLEDICNGFGITLSQFFATGSEPVSLNDEQVAILEKWATLSDEQKKALLELIK